MKIIHFAIFFVAAIAMPAATAQLRVVPVEHTPRIANSHHPELLYWFIDPAELRNNTWRKHLDQIAADGTFDFVFLTQRSGANFYDTDAMHTVFEDLVASAHAKGIRVGLQLWTKPNGMRPDQLQSLVVEDEVTLDAAGKANFTTVSKGVRNAPAKPLYKPVRAELLRVYAFQKTAEGEYKPGSVKDITGSAKAVAVNPSTLNVRVSYPALAGATIYAMSAFYSEFPGLFTDFVPQSFTAEMEAFRDIPFDGTALDEFRYMSIGHAPNEPFRQRLYSPAMAIAFEKAIGKNLARSLFDMRYSPSGDPSPRIAAIDNYFELLRQRILYCERSFAENSTRIFGPNTFHGIHDTFHNSLEGDEAWQTGINWWSVPRDYGQTDETTPFTTRLGIGLAHPMPVEYNQYYTKDLHRFLEEGILDARFNIRVHYHAFNDVQHWGLDLADPATLKALSTVEDKVRLLNAFDAPRPALNILYIYGNASQNNWFQKDGSRSEFDLNVGLRAEEKAVEGWTAGYRGAFVSSVLIDEGKIANDGKGALLYGGTRFSAVVYIGPEFATDATLKVLETFTASGGKLMLDGNATHDFRGNNITTRFAAIADRATIHGFDAAKLSQLGIAKLAIPDGSVYTDNSVVLTDLDSLLKHQAKPFSIRVQGHTFSGSYIGLIAIAADMHGQLTKLAGGGIKEIQCDGKPVVRLSEPADVILKRQPSGTFTGTVVGASIVSAQ